MNVTRFDHILERGSVKLSSFCRTTFGRIVFVALVVARRTLVAVEDDAENLFRIQASNRFIDQVSWISTGANDDKDAVNMLLNETAIGEGNEGRCVNNDVIEV